MRLSLKSAKAFHDYAMLGLGIPAGNIKELVFEDAHPIACSHTNKDGIAQTTKKVSTDIQVFFAGQGLASDDEEQMYLVTSRPLPDCFIPTKGKLPTKFAVHFVPPYIKRLKSD